MSIIIDVFFPVIGIGIIVFCILSFIFPFGRRFKDKIQKIKAFGVDIEVSVLTLFIIVGFALSFLGVYLNIRTSEADLVKRDKQISDEIERNKILQERINGLQEIMERSEKMDICVLLSLENDNVHKIPELAHVECECYFILEGKTVSKKVEVKPGIKNDQFQITLRDITRDMMVLKLVFTDRNSNTKWLFTQPFSPSIPELQLKIGE